MQERVCVCPNLAAVVLHQCGRHVDMVTRAQVLSGLLKDDPARFDAFGPPGKLHVLDVDQRGVDVFDGQEAVVYAVDLFMFHSTLRRAEDTGGGVVVRQCQ